MHVAIDARELLGHATGVGRYLRGLLEAWTREPRAQHHRLSLIVPRAVTPWPWLGRDGAAWHLVAAAGSGTSAWEQWTLPWALRRLAPDLLFAPAYSSPLVTSCPVVLALHDLSFVAHPEWFRWREGLKRRWLARAAARRAAAIVTISEFSRQEIVARLGLPANRIVLAPPGGEDSAPQPPAAPGRRTGRGPHVLYVGSIFNRRHLPALIEAFSRVLPRWPDARLSIVGENRTHPHQPLEALVERLGLDRAVAIHSYVAQAGLDAAFATADVFVFVSEYEGFGIPPLEAVGRGVPVIIGDTAVSHEVFGSGATYVTPGDVDALARALADLIAQPDRAARELDAARAYTARYRWDDSAMRVLACFERAASGRGPRQ